MTEFEVFEERVYYQQRFQGVRLDFRGQGCFKRYDCCEFVKTTVLINDTTQALAFTNGVFEDSNIEGPKSDAGRSLIARDNMFKAEV